MAKVVWVYTAPSVTREAPLHQWGLRLEQRRTCSKAETGEPAKQHHEQRSENTSACPDVAGTKCLSWDAVD